MRGARCMGANQSTVTSWPRLIDQQAADNATGALPVQCIPPNNPAAAHEALSAHPHLVDCLVRCRACFNVSFPPSKNHMHAFGRPLMYERLQRTIAHGGLVLHGDSHVAKWPSAQPMTNVTLSLLGIGMDTYGHALPRAWLVRALLPQRVLVVLGVNDLNAGVLPETTRRDARATLRYLKAALPRGTPLAVHPIFAPPKLRAYGELPRFNRELPRFNRDMHALCAEEHVRYLAQLEDAFRPEEHFLPRDMHLNLAGYAWWSARLAAAFGSGTANTEARPCPRGAWHCTSASGVNSSRHVARRK